MQLDSFTVYLDENHCNNRRVLAVLKGAGVVVERHLDHFPRGTPDEHWLPFVEKNGWALVTTDKRIRYHSNERQAVIQHAVRMFYFSKNDMSGEQMATTLQKALPTMRRLMEQQEPPFFAAITRKGEVFLKEKLAAPPNLPGTES